MREYARLACAVVAVCALALSRPCLAQATSKAAAEALFEEGKKLAAEQNYAAACAKFEASQRLEAALGTQLHLADCYDRWGKTASAWALFKEAASLAAASAQDQRASVARTRATALEARLTKVRVVVPPAHRVKGLSVALNGVVVQPASWGSAIPVDPGDQLVLAAAPNHRRWVGRTRVSGEGRLYRVVVPRLVSEAAVRRTVPGVAPSESLVVQNSERERSVAEENARRDTVLTGGTTQRVWGAVVGAFGLAAFSAGCVLGFVADGKYDESLDECRADDESLCTPAGVERREEAQDYALASAAALGGGGALLVTGVVLYFTAPSSAPATKETSWVPAVTRRGGVFTWRGTW